MAFAQVEVGVRQAGAADPTLPWEGIRRTLVERPRCARAPDVILALARSHVHRLPPPLKVGLVRVNDLRIRVVHRGYQPTDQELVRSLVTCDAVLRWLAVHHRRLTARSATIGPTATVTSAGSRE